MVDTLSSFINWLQSEMNAKNLTQADIARSGFVTTAAVSKLFAFQFKSVGIDMCKAVSTATGIPLITVMEKAGILPPQGELTPKKRQLLELADNADEHAVESAIAVLEASVRSKQRK